jgi:hypothetical protein
MEYIFKERKKTFTTAELLDGRWKKYDKDVFPEFKCV